MMRKNKTCYCEVGFLTEFINSHPTVLEPNDEIIRLMGNWISMYQFICKADVVLDISSAEFSKLKEESEWMRMFWKKSSNGECKIEFVGKSKFPYVNKLSYDKCSIRELNAVYLTIQPDNICTRLSTELGVVVLNNNLVKDCAHLFRDNGTEFPSDKAKDWDFLKHLNKVFPSINICNSMIIVDNYLFSDDVKNEDNEKVKYNLLPILKILLPNSLAEGEIFEIAVFTGEDKERSFEIQLNYFRSFITKIRPNLEVKICFYGKTQKEFHDRAILTNNVWMSSGHGFDIFGRSKDVGKPTTINIAFPFVQNKLLWCDGSYLNVISQADFISNKRLNKPNLNYWGDIERTNRIIQYYKEDSKESEDTKENTSPDFSERVFKPNMKIDLTKIPGYNQWGRKRF